MKLSKLIHELQLIYARHGEQDVFLEVPGDEHDIGDFESFICQNKEGNPRLCVIKAEGVKE